MGRFVDLTNRNFGRLVVISRHPENNAQGKPRWLCHCSCGNTCIVSRNELISGDAKSCGCIRKEVATEQLKNVPKKQKLNLSEEKKLENAIKSFWKKVKKTSSCWNWNASTRSGYGQFKYNEIKLAHRFSYFIHKGELEKDKIICHTCDNPICVNPDHLYQGTYQDNSKDAVERRRKPVGENSNLSKLKENQVVEILSSKEGHRSLARKFGVDHQSIYRIRKGRSWKHMKRTQVVED